LSRSVIRAAASSQFSDSTGATLTGVGEVVGVVVGIGVGGSGVEVMVGTRVGGGVGEEIGCGEGVGMAVVGAVEGVAMGTGDRGGASSSGVRMESVGEGRSGAACDAAVATGDSGSARPAVDQSAPPANAANTATTKTSTNGHRLKTTPAPGLDYPTCSPSGGSTQESSPLSMRTMSVIMTAPSTLIRTR